MLLINGQSLPLDFESSEANWKRIATTLAGIEGDGALDAPARAVKDSLRALPSGFVTPFEPQEISRFLTESTKSRADLNALAIQLDRHLEGLAADITVEALQARFSHLRNEFEREGDLAALQNVCCEAYELITHYWQRLYGDDRRAASEELESLRSTYMRAFREYEGPPFSDAWYVEQSCVGFVTENGKAGSATVKECVFGKVTNETGKMGVFHFDSRKHTSEVSGRTDPTTLLRHLDTLAPEGSDTPLKVSLAGANMWKSSRGFNMEYCDKSIAKLAFLLELLQDSPKTYDLTTLDVLKSVGQVPSAIVADRHGLHQGMATRGEEQGRLYNAVTSIQLDLQRMSGNRTLEPYTFAFDLEQHPGVMAGVFIRQEAGKLSAITAPLDEIEILENFSAQPTLKALFLVERMRVCERANGAATEILMSKLERDLEAEGFTFDGAKRQEFVKYLLAVPKFVGDRAAELNKPLENAFGTLLKTDDTSILLSVMGQLVGNDPLAYTAACTPNPTGPNRPGSSRVI